MEKSVRKTTVLIALFTLTFNDLPKGRYAIIVLRDENQNGKIDKGFVLPIEDIGLSNYESIGLSNGPNFSKTSFELDSDVLHRPLLADALGLMAYSEERLLSFLYESKFLTVKILKNRTKNPERYYAQLRFPHFTTSYQSTETLPEKIQTSNCFIFKV